MDIGIIGLGIVGEACRFGFTKLGHIVKIHDLKLGTKISDVLNTDIIFVCVPTPSKPDGSCDTSIVEEVVDDILLSYDYHGLIVIKSTIPPGTTECLKKKCYGIDFKGNDIGYENICFVPEFLKERTNIADFVENHKILVVGSMDKKHQDLIIEAHGSYPKKVMCVSPTEAELIKYAHNTLNALRVTFANELCEITTKLDANYNKVKEAILASTGMPDQYMDSSPMVKGWSSICFNKDLPALYNVIDELGLDLPLIKTIVPANEKFKKTPFSGTRE